MVSSKTVNKTWSKTVCITGDLQLGLLITSIILFTLLLLMGKNRLILLWSCFCYVKLEIFPFMLHLVTSGEMGPKLVRSHTQQRILSHGCFSLYLAQTIPMRTRLYLINRDINANAVIRNILNFLGQNRWGHGSVSLSWLSVFQWGCSPCFASFRWQSGQRINTIPTYENSRIIQAFECQLFLFCCKKSSASILHGTSRRKSSWIFFIHKPPAK